MAAPNRSSLIGKAHRVLKKHFRAAASTANLPVMEHLLFAHCLENAKYEKAIEAFERLRQAFFDWNEVRVTTVTELAEVLRGLPNPAHSGAHIKRTLHSVFESRYSFELEDLKKQNLGAAVKQLQKYDGVTPFAVAHATQTALGGHAIPLDEATLDTLYIMGIISDDEKTKGVAPGLERAIPKKKGIEFTLLLHDMSAEFHASPFQPKIRAILTEVTADAQARFPKRTTAAAPAKPAEPSKPAAAAADETKKKKTSAENAPQKTTEKASEKLVEKPVQKPAAKEKPAAPAEAKKAAPAPKPSRPTPKPAPAARKKPPHKANTTSATKKLTKRKPR